jgi:outer membrane murein-binding lipoprotein Lpp
MSEQVQVREGVWRTRDGREIAIRARDFGDSEPTPWCWCSESTGEFETWRNDGWNTFSYRYHKQPLDLIEYLRPLPGTESTPEQQTTTDTLAEIEAQADEPAEPDGETWKVLAIRHDKARRAMEENRDLLWQAVQELQATQSTIAAERDELARELAVSAQHVERQRQQMEVMTSERDILAQRLITKPSEESLQKRVAKSNIEINTLKDQLQDISSERLTLQSQVQQLQTELRQARIEIDAAAQDPGEAAKDAAHEQGFDRGQAWAFSAVHSWVRPLAGADSEDAVLLLQALPGCIRRLAGCEGVAL